MSVRGRGGRTRGRGTQRGGSLGRGIPPTGILTEFVSTVHTSGTIHQLPYLRKGSESMAGHGRLSKRFISQT